MKTDIINSGYVTIKIPKVSSRLIHRIVAKEFCEGYVSGLTVNHRDANRLNNHADNLEWVTHSQNIRDAFDRGTGDTQTARSSVNLSKSVTQMDKEGNEIRVWGSMVEASKELGIQQSKISSVCGGHRKTTGGYRWRFTNPGNNQSVDRNHKVTRVSESGETTTYPSMLKASESIKVNSSTLARHFKLYGSPIEYKGYKWYKE